MPLGTSQAVYFRTYESIFLLRGTIANMNYVSIFKTAGFRMRPVVYIDEH